MDVYHHIRESNQRAPILFTLGNIEFLETVKELKQAGTFVDHIPKPYSNEDYAHAVDQLLIRGKKQNSPLPRTTGSRRHFHHGGARGDEYPANNGTRD